MSIETGDLTVPASVVERPLPPEVTFNAVTGTFAGTAEPAKTVRLTSSADQRMRTATADANGKWTIALGSSPRWYTRFEIWVCDPEAGESSQKVKFTFGGRNPRLSGVYAGKTLAFGQSRSGARVVVFGPRGQVLGRALALGKYGAWTVDFNESLNAGDTVCVLAESFGGDTSMPFFAEAQAFSVTDRNVGHIAGTGAEPGDLIQLYDSAAGQVIASTAASESGEWDVSFCTPIEAGTRIAVERVHLNGTTSSGPTFTTTLNDCLAPSISSFSGTQMSGMASTGLLVTYAQIRNGQTIHSDTVSPQTPGIWSSDTAVDHHDFDFQPGDILTAFTTSADGTQRSIVSSNVTVDGSRPGAALVEYIDETGARGWIEPHKFIVASTAEAGAIGVAESGFLGHWSIDWAEYFGSLPTTTIVVFEVFDSLVQNNLAPSSLLVARYANALSSQPAAPVFTKYLTTDIEGTEATDNTAVVVHNNSTGQDINPDGATVTNNSWKVLPTGSKTPGNGQTIQATAWTLTGNNQFGVSSEPSTPETVSGFSPPQPVVLKSLPTDIEGTENILGSGDLSITTIYTCPASDLTRTPIGNSGHLTSPNWTITPNPARTPGEKMVAWAQTDPGALSSEAEYTIAAATKPIPPSIGNWSSPDIYGGGVNGTLVQLKFNDQLMGSNVVSNRGWNVGVGVTPGPGDHLYATATDTTQTPPAESDPYTIAVGQDRPNLSMDNSAITTTSAGGSVDMDNQRILAWRQSDGLQVVNYPVATKGAFTAPYLAGSNIQSQDLLMFVSQTNDGDPEAMMSTYQGVAVN